MLGYHPQMFAWRVFILLQGCLIYCQIASIARFNNAPTLTSYSSLENYDNSVDDNANRALFVLTATMGFVMQCPLRYVDVSSWGIYCCASMPNIRVLRGTYLQVFMAFMHYYMTKYLIGMSIQGGVTGAVVAPALVFGWKRLLYLLEVSTNIHDTPFKGHVFVLAPIYALHSMNLAVTTAQIGVPSWADSLTYIGIDWITYILRIGIVGRFGFKTCPKLVSYLVLKQIENLPTPLERNVSSAGTKTAMRCCQAYFALLEGETMTTCFAFHALHYIILFLAFREMDMVQITPMRNFFILVMFTGLDLIQDILADHVSNKFSYWSYIYKKSGWFSSLMRPFMLVNGIVFGLEFNVWTGMRPRTANHNLVRMFFGTAGPSSAGCVHY
jgi:hypothetical protein